MYSRPLRRHRPPFRPRRRPLNRGRSTYPRRDELASERARAHNARESEGSPSHRRARLCSLCAPPSRVAATSPLPTPMGPAFTQRGCGIGTLLVLLGCVVLWWAETLLEVLGWAHHSCHVPPKLGGVGAFFAAIAIVGPALKMRSRRRQSRERRIRRSECLSRLSAYLTRSDQNRLSMWGVGCQRSFEAGGDIFCWILKALQSMSGIKKSEHKEAVPTISPSQP